MPSVFSKTYCFSLGNCLRVLILELPPCNIMKNKLALYLFYLASSCLHVLKTSTDHSQQLSAPFKAGNSRQFQTCYISQEYNTKKLQHYNWLIPAQEKWEFPWPWTTEHLHNDACCLSVPSFSLQHDIRFGITMSLLQQYQ